MNALTEHIKYVSSKYKQGRRVIPDPFVALTVVAMYASSSINKKNRMEDNNEF